MPRTDIQEHEIGQLRRKAQRVLEAGEPWELSKLDAERLLRLTGEVLELRNREAHVRQIQAMEGDEY
jgi:chromosome condensin MukBEF complex kleisin-like MukF subunit